MKQVKTLIGMLLIIGAGFDAFSQSITPNYVKDEIMVDPDSAPSITISYSDGLGRGLQTSLFLEDNKARVSGSLYDDIGRPSKTTVPFINTTTDFTSTMDYIADPLTPAQTDRGAYPYNESRYKPDPLNRPDSIGAPGADFSIAGAHFGRAWYFGTEIGVASAYIDVNGFIRESKLTNEELDACEALTQITTNAPTHFLTVTKGPNDDSYSQKITDIFGNPIAMCAMEGIKSENTYDILGNTLSENPPDTMAYRTINSAMATKYQYNTAGQLINKTTPDAGLIEYMYDNAGRLIASQNAKQALSSGDLEYTVYFYDDFGRNFAVGINKTSVAFHSIDPNTTTWNVDNADQIDLRIRKIFDDPANLAAVLGSAFTPTYFASYFCPIENTQGRLVAEIAYQSNPAIVDPTSSNFFHNLTVDMYSYDENGNAVAKLKRIPGMKDFCMFTYSYDQLGNLITYKYAKNDKRADPTMDNMQYRLDRHGRRIAATSTNALGQTNPLVDNSYKDNNNNDYGLLNRKVFGYNTNHAAFIDAMQYTYNVRNAITSITGNLFGEPVICYNDWTLDGNTTINGYPMRPQYNGNISGVKYQYTIGGTTTSGHILYWYDDIGELKHAATDNNSLFADENFTYYANGQLHTKQRAGSPLGSPYTGFYAYLSNTNKVHKIVGYPGKANDNNYVYDPNGNMVLDVSKKMVVDYDWRDMPISFRFYKSVPSLSGDAIAMWNALNTFVANNAAEVKSEVKMVYDASGNRVMKKEYRY